MTTTQKKAVGLATGKIILIGEHSAVYGKPAIAIPCTAVTAKTTILPNDNHTFIQSDLYCGFIDDIPNFLIGIKIVIEETLAFLNQRHATLHITIDSTIPLERGMGSSAAISVSIIKALFHFFNATPTPQDLFNLSELSEKIMHGNPSGLDATTIISQEAVLFQKGTPVQPFSFNLGAYLVIADSGITGQTKIAVEKVAKLQHTDYKLHEQLISHLHALTIQTQQTLNDKNISTLGAIFNSAHSTLKQLGVSDEQIDKLVTAALENGAIGAKLTGGGLGGCLFALTDTMKSAEKVSSALLKSGAIQTYIQKI